MVDNLPFFQIIFKLFFFLDFQISAIIVQLKVSKLEEAIVSHVASPSVVAYAD